MAERAGDGTEERVGRRTAWRDWAPAIALGAGFVGVIASILAIGVAMLGAMNDMRAELRTEIESVRGELKADIANLRTELKTDIENVRTELKADIENVRTELKADIENVRTELKAEIENVRTELKAEIDSVRTELKAEIRGVRTEFGDEIDGVKAQNRELETGHAETRERLAHVEGQLGSRAEPGQPAESENAGG